MTRVVIVGGGIAGMLAALQLQPYFGEVVLIEQDKKIGGLMQSWCNESGDFFDYGTHIPGYTGINDLDNLLYSGLNDQDWLHFTHLKTGNFFAGRYNSDNQFINTTAMSVDIHARGLVDLLAARPLNRRPETLFEELNSAFGKTYTEQIFRPLMRKIFDHDLEELAPGVHHPFGHSRLIVADPATSRELKHSPLYDSKLSYVYYNEAPKTAHYIYPRQGGVGKLVDALHTRLKSRNVRILTGAQVHAISCSASRIQSISLQSGEKFSVDHLVWTAAPIMLLRAAKLKFTTSPPSFIPMSLHHLVFDKPPQVDSHFFNCNDPKMHAFRGTLYSNLRQLSNSAPRHSITIEAVDHQSADIDEIGRKVVTELAQTGVIKEDAKLLSRNSIQVKAGFPVFTTSWINTVAHQREMAKSIGENLSLLGRSAGNTFYMNHVLLEIYNHINERFS